MRKNWGSAKEPNPKQVQGIYFQSNACETSERTAKELKNRNTYEKIEREIVLSLLSHPYPPTRARVSRARARRNYHHVGRHHAGHFGLAQSGRAILTRYLERYASNMGAGNTSRLKHSLFSLSDFLNRGVWTPRNQAKRQRRQNSRPGRERARLLANPGASRKGDR